MSKTNPWRILSQSRQYENSWVDVLHHDVITPSGGSGIYGIVRFKHLTVAVLPVDAEGHVWLVGQYRLPVEAYSWEIPEGGCPLDEDPLTAAKRELREETGLEAKTWRRILEMDMSNAITDERSISFIARDLQPGPPSPDPTEKLELRRLPFAALYEMVLAGDIRDSLTVATVLRAAPLLRDDLRS